MSQSVFHHPCPLSCHTYTSVVLDQACINCYRQCVRPHHHSSASSLVGCSGRIQYPDHELSHSSSQLLMAKTGSMNHYCLVYTVWIISLAQSLAPPQDSFVAQLANLHLQASVHSTLYDSYSAAAALSVVMRCLLLSPPSPTPHTAAAPLPALLGSQRPHSAHLPSK